MLNLVSQEIQLTNAQVIILNESMYDRSDLLIKWIAEYNNKKDLIDNGLLSVLIRSLAADVGKNLNANKGVAITEFLQKLCAL